MSTPMRPSRWDPFRDLAILRSEMLRMMGQESREGRWAPEVDVLERDNETVLMFDLPGIEESEIDIEISDENVLTVHAKREREEREEGERYFHYERRYGEFARSVRLPAGIDTEQISADYTNGVLQLHLPKPVEQEPRRIELGMKQDEGNMQEALSERTQQQETETTAS